MSELNPELREELGTLRGGMLAAAERTQLSSRFQIVLDKHSPQIMITDTETGRSTTVGLCDYHGARQALNDLFG